MSASAPPPRFAVVGVLLLVACGGRGPTVDARSSDGPPPSEAGSVAGAGGEDAGVAASGGSPGGAVDAPASPDVEDDVAASDVAPDGSTLEAAPDAADGTEVGEAGESEAGACDATHPCASGRFCHEGTCHLAAIAVGPGSQQSCVALVDGTVRCWGDDSLGELGDGLAPSNIEVAPERARTVVGIADAVAVGAGRWHACALRADGQVRCWGDNSHAELGARCAAGTVCNSSTPVAVTGAPKAVALAVGREHTCTIGGAGKVTCWGRNERGQLGQPFGDFVAEVPDVAGATFVAAGWNYSCAVVGTGQVRCWGGCDSGALQCPTATVPGIDDATAVGIGQSDTCARRRDGSVWCWADNFHQTTGPWKPARVDGVAAASTISRACALTNAGGVSCWSLTPATNVVAVDVTDVAKLVVGPETPNALVIESDGSVRAWVDPSKPSTLVLGW